MSKVIFLKLVPQSFAKSDGPLSSELLDSIARGRSAIVIERTPDDLLAIQGYPLVPWKDKHKCWSLFRNAARNLLGIVQSSAISIRFADPPFTAVTSITAILREPSHIVDLIVSSLETPVNTVPVEPAANLWGLQGKAKVDPYCRYREFYQDRAKADSGCVRNKCNFEEMNKLISQLSEVSISLQRTQHECDEIAKRCSSTRKTALKFEATDGEELAEDSNVEKLLHIAESLTAHIIRQQSKQNQEGSPALPAAEPPILPMCPSDICVRPSFSGGVYVMWNPVRLDARDENRGHKVLGYMVYCDGALKAQVEGALTSQVEIHMLEGEKEYDIRVCTHTELCNSPLSAAVTYRHAHPKNYSLPPSNTSQLPKNRKLAKVESWLKTSRLDSGIDSTGSNDEDLRDYHVSHVHFAEDATHQQEGTELDDSKSTTSSHTSGIVTDMPPVSPKLRPACSCNNCTTPLCGNSPSHTSHDLCYCSSPVFSTFSGDNAFDTVIDEPIETEPVKQVSLPSVMNVYTTQSPKRAGPPQNVTVQPTHTGYIRVSWTPVRRDFRGCCNGCFVLGYRIYVNGTSHLSVDGPTVYEALLQCPPLVPPPQHRMLIHVRTRSISSESGPSNTVIYDMLVHRTVETSGRRKLDSALSSAASLYRVESHQLPQRMPGGVARKHLGRSVETYV